MLAPLPIDDHLDEILDLVRRRRAVVVVAAPGAGKTTRVAPALAADGPVLLLQPRRLAARALARRIAEERGWTPGREVGWQVRFERRFEPDTRLLVVTEGILTRRLQSDPLLSDFRTVVLDEFHERSLNADLGLALCRQALRARHDLRIVVLSATLDARAVAGFLGDCPVLEIPGRTFPVEVRHAPGLTLHAAAQDVLRQETGDILCFLPGAPEIRRAAEDLQSAARQNGDTAVLALHGSLDAGEQDRALAPCARRKLILATNLAETSLTVEGVSDVIDSGLHKVLRRDAGTGIDRLATERISRDSAEQRAGRAGRTAPGRALRLWDARDELRAYREPEIERVDLAGPFLQVLAWGGDPLGFEWFQQPHPEAARTAMELLEALGAVQGGRLTELGRGLERLPLHPRLGRVLLAAGGSRLAAAACAVLAEGWRPRADGAERTVDIAELADRIGRAPERVRLAAADLERQAALILGSRSDASDLSMFRRAWLAGYPDRVARRRPGEPGRLLLASGHGAKFDDAAGLSGSEFLVALDLAAGQRGQGSEALVRLSSPVERDWLETTRRGLEHAFDERAGVVRAIERDYLGEIVLSERSVAPDPEEAAKILVQQVLAKGPDGATVDLVRRARFAGVEVDWRRWVERACAGRTRLADVDVRAQALCDLNGRELDRLAPATLRVPSGRSVRLEYRDDGGAYASIKLQELFGLAETPRIGPRGDPVTFQLLAPNGRPVQTTRDLRSFWERTYPIVRKELRARYPKHAWPDKP